MGKSIRILNVEDSDRDAMLVNRHLSAAGYEIESLRVETADAMASTLSAQKWDIVLCDYSMPNFGALQALATLKASNRDVPLIIISGTVGEDIAVEAMLSGANDYLSKDNLTRLVPAIERELTESENRRIQRQSEREKKAIFDILQAIITTPNIDDFFTLVHRSIRNIIYAENCFVVLQDPRTGYCHYEFWADKNDPRPDPRPADHGFASYVMRTGNPLLVTDAVKKWLKDEGEAEVIGTAAASWIGVPLRTPVRTIGALVLQHYENADAYNERDLHFLKSVGDQIALTIDRKRSEEALRESEGRYRMLFDYAPDGIMISDDASTILDVNPSICSSLGYTTHELIGLTCPDVISLTDIRYLEAARAQVKKEKEHQREWQFRRRDGTVFPAEVIATQMPDGHVLSMIRDASERQQAEKERTFLTSQIEAQRERLNNIVTNVPGIVWETSGGPDREHGGGSFVSDYVTTMIGYSVEEWLAMPNFWLSIVHPDHREKVARDAAAAFVNGEDCVQEFPWIAKDGRVVWVEAHSAVVFDGLGMPIGVRGVTIDINDRKLAAEALRESEERYRDLVENAIDMIYAHDLQGNYTSVNRSAERITGYTRDEVLTMNLTQTVAPEYVEKAREMIAAKLAGKGDTAYELEIIAKDGRRISVEVNTRLIYENGAPVSIQGIARDTTERKHLEEQFRQSQKMEAIGLLAGGIAHDFNNLLTAISGYSELTLSKMRHDDPLRHNISEIKDAGDRAAALTGQLLAFSRKQVLKPRVHSLNSVITDIERMLRRIIRESVEFHTELDPALQNIKADPGQIEQVIMNLSVNARDAMPNGGKLFIKTENVHISESRDEPRLSLSPGQYAKMTVTDTGEGMDEETLSRMFEPFFTTKEAGKGTGLGLSTVYGIVKQSGGEILVDSELGHGTTFEIYLPSVADPAQHIKSKPVQTWDEIGSETILLVEDEEVVRNLVREILEGNGYSVLEAAGGKAAMDICRSTTETIDLLLTDVIMPHMSGIELKKNVLKLMPDIKILLMSGYTDDAATAVDTFDSRTGFIEKPFTPDSLSRKVREILDA